MRAQKRPERPALGSQRVENQTSYGIYRRKSNAGQPHGATHHPLAIRHSSALMQAHPYSSGTHRVQPCITPDNAGRLPEHAGHGDPLHTGNMPYAPDDFAKRIALYAQRPRHHINAPRYAARVCTRTNERGLRRGMSHRSSCRACRWRRHLRLQRGRFPAHGMIRSRHRQDAGLPHD